VPDHGGYDWEMALERAYHVAYAVLRNPSLAEEVAQQACVRALVKLDTFEGRCGFPSWVRAIALRIALDVKAALAPASIDPDELAASDNPEDAAHEHRAWSTLHRCLEELTERQRLMFLAKHLDGMKGAEIAAEMNTKEGTVWATINQAAANLRGCLDRHGIDRGVLH
jgi:RNA polymerase sigma-70 factor, ECF subfamily